MLTTWLLNAEFRFLFSMTTLLQLGVNNSKTLFLLLYFTDFKIGTDST